MERIPRNQSLCRRSLPVGVKRDILEKDDIGIGLSVSSRGHQYEALVSLCQEKSPGVELGLEGGKVVEQFYNADIIVFIPADIFQSLLCK